LLLDLFRFDLYYTFMLFLLDFIDLFTKPIYQEAKSISL
jgi:hypothetical protein